MNHTSWNAQSAKAICVRFTKLHLPSSKDQGFTQQTIKERQWNYALYAIYASLLKTMKNASNVLIWLYLLITTTRITKTKSYPQVSVVVDKSDRHAASMRKVIHRLDMRGTLRWLEAFRASHRARKGIARGVAAAIGLSLFLPMGQVSEASIVPTKRALKAYTRTLLSANQYQCVSTLWGKESAWNHAADNPHSTAYGIPQILGMKTKDPYVQIHKGLIYIDKRYSTPCKALRFHVKHGWY